MIFVIDNYDSFTYNLVQYVGSLGVYVVVKRNDQTTIKEIEKLHPDKIIISPGPGYPDEAGISMDVINYFKDKCPILGVCLGHQSIGQVFGCFIAQADELFHGKDSLIYHDQQSIYRNIPNPFRGGRYHSLVVERGSVPESLIITAETSNGLVMGLRHKTFSVEGVQFHPESILTERGIDIIENFIKNGGHNDK